jgi:hypothetical protein
LTSSLRLHIIASDALASPHQPLRNIMRTTLDIDDSVLSAVKELARRQGKTAGEVLSMLARQALINSVQPSNRQVQERPASYGFKPLPANETLVTNDVVDKLRDEQGV